MDTAGESPETKLFSTAVSASGELEGGEENEKENECPIRALTRLGDGDDWALITLDFAEGGVKCILDDNVGLVLLSSSEYGLTRLGMITCMVSK